MYIAWYISFIHKKHNCQEVYNSLKENLNDPDTKECLEDFKVLNHVILEIILESYKGKCNFIIKDIQNIRMKI